LKNPSAGWFSYADFIFHPAVCVFVVMYSMLGSVNDGKYKVLSETWKAAMQ